jgi:hypothetical protein
MLLRLFVAGSIDCDMQVSGESVEDDVVDAVVTASRAMIAVAVRSLSGLAEDITIAQYRTLVVLASRGPQKLADLAGLRRALVELVGRCDHGRVAECRILEALVSTR